MAFDVGSMHLTRSLFGDRPSAGDAHVAAKVPLAGLLVSVALNFITLPVLGACLTRRIERIGKWSRLPVSAWLLLIIYVDSALFIFTTAVLRNIGLNKSDNLCDGTILFCLTCYMSTKILIYIFLVEKAWIVRGSLQRRRDSKLYLFNCYGMLLPYAICIVLNFKWRISFIDTTGKCIIGTQVRAMMPFIAFEVVVNVYLNILFIIPLRKLYTYRHGSGKMRTLALRTLIGSCFTLVSSVINLTVLMAVGGEPSWLCLMLCNLDILFCALVLHWATKFDSSGTGIGSSCSCGSNFRRSTNASTPYPSVMAQKCRNLFSGFDCEEDFPEGCMKAHPWSVEEIPDIPALVRPQAVLTKPESGSSGSLPRKDSEIHADRIETVAVESGTRDSRAELSI